MSIGPMNSTPPPPFERMKVAPPTETDSEKNFGIVEMFVELYHDMKQEMQESKLFRQFIWGMFAMLGIFGMIAMAKHVWIPLIFGK